MGSSHLRTKLCVVCQTRQARYFNGTCTPCRNLLEAEGSHALYGISKDSKFMARYREMAKQYNTLAKQLRHQSKIAPAMGLTLTQLRNLVYRMRGAGLKIVNLKSGLNPVDGDSKFVATKRTPPVRNEHGGGRWGVANCDCVPCKERVAASRKDVEDRRRRRRAATVEGLQERVAELEAQLAKYQKKKT